jgi:hypothetical protein
MKYQVNITRDTVETCVLVIDAEDEDAAIHAAKNRVRHEALNWDRLDVGHTDYDAWELGEYDEEQQS